MLALFGFMTPSSANALRTTGNMNSQHSAYRKIETCTPYIIIVVGNWSLRSETTVGENPPASKPTRSLDRTDPTGSSSTQHLYKNHPANSPCLLYVDFKCQASSMLSTSTVTSVAACRATCEVGRCSNVYTPSI